MNDRLNDALAVLAEKLGTSADHLWAVLVRQARIDATVSLIQYTAIVWACVVWWRCANSTTSEDWDDPSAKSIGLVVGGTLLVLFATLAFFDIPNTISGFFNPEYWALDSILKTARGGK